MQRCRLLGQLVQHVVDLLAHAIGEVELEELERLHRKTRDRRSEPEILTRRAPFPTSEVDEADIEAAIEIAPPARRTAIGVAKKKKPTE